MLLRKLISIILIIIIALLAAGCSGEPGASLGDVDSAAATSNEGASDSSSESSTQETSKREVIKLTSENSPANNLPTWSARWSVEYIDAAVPILIEAGLLTSQSTNDQMWETAFWGSLGYMAALNIETHPNEITQRDLSEIPIPPKAVLKEYCLLTWNLVMKGEAETPLLGGWVQETRRAIENNPEWLSTYVPGIRDAAR